MQRPGAPNLDTQRSGPGPGPGCPLGRPVTDHTDQPPLRRLPSFNLSDDSEDEGSRTGDGGTALFERRASSLPRSATPLTRHQLAYPDSDEEEQPWSFPAGTAPRGVGGAAAVCHVAGNVWPEAGARCAPLSFPGPMGAVSPRPAGTRAHPRRTNTERGKMGGDSMHGGAGHGGAPGWPWAHEAQHAFGGAAPQRGEHLGTGPGRPGGAQAQRLNLERTSRVEPALAVACPLGCPCGMGSRLLHRNFSESPQRSGCSSLFSTAIAARPASPALGRLAELDGGLWEEGMSEAGAASSAPEALGGRSPGGFPVGAASQPQWWLRTQYPVRRLQIENKWAMSGPLRPRGETADEWHTVEPPRAEAPVAKGSKAGRGMSGQKGRNGPQAGSSGNWAAQLRSASLDTRHPAWSMPWLISPKEALPRGAEASGESASPLSTPKAVPRPGRKGSLLRRTLSLVTERDAPREADCGASAEQLHRDAAKEVPVPRRATDVSKSAQAMDVSPRAEAGGFRRATRGNAGGSAGGGAGAPGISPRSLVAARPEYFELTQNMAGGSTKATRGKAGGGTGGPVISPRSPAAARPGRSPSAPAAASRGMLLLGVRTWTPGARMSLEIPASSPGHTPGAPGGRALRSFESEEELALCSALPGRTSSQEHASLAPCEGRLSPAQVNSVQSAGYAMALVRGRSAVGEEESGVLSPNPLVGESTLELMSAGYDYDVMSGKGMTSPQLQFLEELRREAPTCPGRPASADACLRPMANEPAGSGAAAKCQLCEQYAEDSLRGRAPALCHGDVAGRDAPTSRGCTCCQQGKDNSSITSSLSPVHGPGQSRRRPWHLQAASPKKGGSKNNQGLRVCQGGIRIRAARSADDDDVTWETATHPKGDGTSSSDARLSGECRGQGRQVASWGGTDQPKLDATSRRSRTLSTVADQEYSEEDFLQAASVPHRSSLSLVGPGFSWSPKDDSLDDRLVTGEQEKVARSGSRMRLSKSEVKTLTSLDDDGGGAHQHDRTGAGPVPDVYAAVGHPYGGAVPRASTYDRNIRKVLGGSEGDQRGGGNRFQCLGGSVVARTASDSPRTKQRQQQRQQRPQQQQPGSRKKHSDSSFVFPWKKGSMSLNSRTHEHPRLATDEGKGRQEHMKSAKSFGKPTSTPSKRESGHPTQQTRSLTAINSAATQCKQPKSSRALPKSSSTPVERQGSPAPAGGRFLAKAISDSGASLDPQATTWSRVEPSPGVYSPWASFGHQGDILGHTIHEEDLKASKDTHS